jgi:hypothetical protein
MTVTHFEEFIEELRLVINQIKEAMESSKEDAIKIYKKIFGDEYFPSQEDLRILKSMEIEIFSTESKVITEINNYKIDLDFEFKLKIQCQPKRRVTPSDTGNPIWINENSGFKLNNLKIQIGVDKYLQFTKKVYGDSYDVEYLWRVWNFGSKVPKDKQRGGIYKYTKGDDLEYRDNIEETAFKGTHVVSCFAIRENKVIAIDYFRVCIV